MFKKLIILLIVLLSLPLVAFKVKTHVSIGRKIISEIKIGKYKDAYTPFSTVTALEHKDMEVLIDKVSAITTDDINIHIPDWLKILELEVGKVLFYTVKSTGNKEKFAISTTTELINCIKDNPQYFMAGNVGPDGFPDIFTGQMATHVSNFDNVTNSSGNITELLVLKHTCNKFKVNNSNTPEYLLCEELINKMPFNGNQEILKRKLDTIPYKYRKASFWRSIDWAQYLIEEATAPLWYEDEDSNKIKSSHPAWKEIDRLINTGNNFTKQEASQKAENLRCQAISFSYGYINHMASDAFSHQFVNILSGGSWDYLDGLSEEIKHVAVEGYIDHLLRPWLYQSPTDDLIYGKINITNPFLNRNNLNTQIKDLYPANNLPIYDIEVPTGFLVETLMSKKIVDASPLSYHIRLFRNFKVYLQDFENKLAYGDKCQEDSDCSNGSSCLSIGYCKRTSSFSYNTIYDECENPSLSAYLFNECMTIGRLGKKDEFQTCLYDLRDYLVFSYLKGIENNVDNAMRNWIDASRDLMRNEMLQDLESSNYKVENKKCNISPSILMKCNSIINNKEKTRCLDIDNHYDCISNKWQPKAPSVNSNGSLEKYLEIMNSLLDVDENSPINRLFSSSCNSISRYNYVNICETVMGKLKTDIDEFKETIRGKLREKMLNYLKPILTYTVKIKKLIKQHTQPDDFLRFAYCANVDDFKNFMNSCDTKVGVCEASDSSCEEGSFYIEEVNCSEEIPVVSECDEFIIARKKIIMAMGLMDSNNTLYKNNEMKPQKNCDNGAVEYGHLNYKCWHQKLLDTGRRFSFMKFNNRINHDFYVNSPFQKSYFIFNSVQLGKLALIDGFFKQELFIYFNKYGLTDDINKTHYSESKCSQRDNYIFESIASLDGSKDINNEKDFNELNKDPKFCLLVDKSSTANHLYDRLFLALPDYSNISNNKWKKYVPVIVDYLKDVKIINNYFINKKKVK